MYVYLALATKLIQQPDLMILDKIGEGHFCDVFRAEYFGAVVAIKKLQPWVTKRKDLVRQHRLAASIIALYSYGLYSYGLYSYGVIVMAEKGSRPLVAETRGQCPLATLAPICAWVCRPVSRRANRQCVSRRAYIVMAYIVMANRQFVSRRGKVRHDAAQAS